MLEFDDDRELEAWTEVTRLRGEVMRLQNALLILGEQRDRARARIVELAPFVAGYPYLSEATTAALADDPASAKVGA
mgnify:CR=1 FL=1